MNPGETPLEVTPEAAHEDQGRGVDLVDIRTPSELVSGTAPGSIELSPEQVRERFQEDPSWRANLVCAGGARSLVLAATLRREGIDGARSVAGGLDRWKSLGLPLTTSTGVSQETADRYARHLVLPQVGPRGQARLAASRVLLAGLGGLNSPVAMYLAAAGVGTLGLADFDRVDRSNLQRQVLYGENDVDRPKTDAARRSLQRDNPGLKTEVIEQRIDRNNVDWIVEGWDVVVDGTDNDRARYALNSACVAARIPLVYGAALRFQGQASVFWPAGGAGAPCFNCLFPEEKASAAPTCAEAGVLGVVPGLVGIVQATETLKLLVGAGETLNGRFLVIDALNMSFNTTRANADPSCAVCG